MTTDEIKENFLKAKNTPSDINEHIQTLLNYANHCEHITEMGVRGVVSTWAFIASSAKKVVAIDIFNVAVPDVDKLQFICADDLEIEIEPTDFLFIDTKHNYTQLKQELDLHAKNVKKYIGFHDTEIFGINGDDGGKGLVPAINEFLSENREWVMEFKTPINNGLTIIRRA